MTLTDVVNERSTTTTTTTTVSTLPFKKSLVAISDWRQCQKYFKPSIIFRSATNLEKSESESGRERERERERERDLGHVVQDVKALLIPPLSQVLDVQLLQYSWFFTKAHLHSKGALEINVPSIRFRLLYMACKIINMKF